MECLHVDYSISAVGHTYVMWQAYLFRDICKSCEVYIYQCFSKFMWGIYTDSYLMCTWSKWNMWHLRGLFASGTHLAIMCEVAVAISWISVDMGKYVGSIYLPWDRAHWDNMTGFLRKWSCKGIHHNEQGKYLQIVQVSWETELLVSDTGEVPTYSLLRSHVRQSFFRWCDRLNQKIIL